MTYRCMRYAKVALVALCAIILVGAVQAESLTYNTRRRVINVGVLRVDTAALGDTASYLSPKTRLFYVMDNRTDVKPRGWEFVNPLTQFDTSTSTPTAYAKSVPAYWWVNSDVPIDDLTQLDVLYLEVPAGTEIALKRHPDLAENLRKFVDGGGVLWIDNARDSTSSSQGSVTGLFIADSFTFATNTASPSSVTDFTHPIVCRPNALSWQDIGLLGVSAYGGTVDFGSLSQPKKYFSGLICASDGNPFVTAAQYGSGYVIITGATVGASIWQPAWNYGTVQAAHVEDLKLAFNIINWESEFGGYHKNARHTGSSFAPVGAPLLSMWEYKPETTTASTSKASPVIVDDMVLYVDGENTLHAFDLYPERIRKFSSSSYENGGWSNNSDDGSIKDYSYGTSYDEIWNHSFNEAISTPAAGYLALDGTSVMPAAGVMTKSGSVAGFDLRSHAPSVMTLPIGTNAFTTDDIPAPAYADGKIFCADGQGGIGGLSLDALKTFTSTVLGKAPSGPPTVGYVRDPATGSVELVAYCGTQGTAAARGDITPYTLRAYNEVVTTSFTASGATVALPTVHANGNPITDVVVKYYATDGTSGTVAGATVSGGTITVPSASIPDGATVKVDYTVDLTANSGKIAQHGGVFPIKTGSETYTSGMPGIEGTPALGTDDTLYFSTTDGNIYAVTQSGIGTASRWIVKWRWCLKDPTPIELFGSGAQTIGSPVVQGNRVYFVVKGSKGSYLLAFRTDSQFFMNIGQRMNQDNSVTVTQVDALNSGASTAISLVQNSEKSPISLNYHNGRVSINNFRQSESAELSSSADMTVIYTPINGVQTTVTRSAFLPYKDSDDSINNLAWAVQLDGTATASPVMMGSIIFTGMAEGKIAAVDVEKMANAAYIAADTTQILKDRTKVDGSVAGTSANSICYWTKQAIDGDTSDVVATAAGAHGMLAVATGVGLSLLYSPVTLVTDQNRVMEVDAAGNVVWSCDGTKSYTSSEVDGGYTAMGGTNTAFNKPTVAKRVDVGGYVVADTGNNRVVLVDSGGNVLWTISSFLDPDHLLPAGTPLTLSGPTDVSFRTDHKSDGTIQYNFLITDGGNSRIIDVAMVKNPSGVYENQLAWTTKTAAQGRAYRYSNSSVLWNMSTGEPTDLFAVISNRQADSTGVETKGSSLVKISLKGTTSGEIIDGPYGTFPLDGTASIDLVNPKFVARRYTSQQDWTDAVIDASGVHIVKHSSSGYGTTYSYGLSEYFTDLKSDTTYVKSYGNKQAFFTPVYAEILPNGNILITNQAIYYGGAGQTLGEVFELQFDSAASVNRYVRTNAFSSGSNSFGLRQPASAVRSIY